MKRITDRLGKGLIALACCVSIAGGSVSVYAAEIHTENVIEHTQKEIETTIAPARVKAVRVAKEEQEAAKAEAERIQKEKEAAAAKKAAEEAAEAQRVANRQELVDYALQFVGNPYVYGGTSLTNGADCSGFTMSVFANFGYSLPRTADAQAYAGTQKSVDSLEPGDLLFYGYGSGISHVAIYIGNGQIVHASTAATGIKISEYNYNEPCMAATYLP